MTQKRRPTVLLADDHRLLAEACRNLLEPEFHVTGIVGDGHALLRAAAETKPDVIVVDIAMPLLNGLDAGKRIKQRMPRVKLVYLTMNPSPGMADEAFRCGASGYVRKTAAATELLAAIRDALQSKLYRSALVCQRTLPQPPHRKARRKRELTLRQREVLQVLAEGHSMKQAALLLRVTPRTIAFHKYRIMALLHLTTNAELVQYAIRKHIITA